jgi:hypothetical protein
MADRPVNLLEPEIALLRRPGEGYVLRPGSTACPGLLGRARPGDRLWVREPFHLDARFDDRAPTAALQFGPVEAGVYWPADHDGGTLPAGIGRRRFAREMPRLLHRAHLVVRSVRFVRLHDLSDCDILVQGFGDRDRFKLHWDAVHAPQARSISGSAIRWKDNPWIVELLVQWRGVPL